MSSPAAFRLGLAVLQRRKDLALNQLEVGQAGGPSNSMLTDIENGRLATLTPSTARKLDTGLQWEPGTARKIWDGDQVTNAGIWVFEPDGSVRDLEHLPNGEELRAALEAASAERPGEVYQALRAALDKDPAAFEGALSISVFIEPPTRAVFEAHKRRIKGVVDEGAPNVTSLRPGGRRDSMTGIQDEAARKETP